MRDCWFDVRRIFQFVELSREAWARQGLQVVAGWLELVCTWFKVVAAVSEVGSVWRKMSYDQSQGRVGFFPNVLQTRGFYGEQNHRERGIQYETRGLTRAPDASNASSGAAG